MIMIDMEKLTERVAKRGLQKKRKDRDTMQDGGGSSKGRKTYRPKDKPPRDDLKKRYRTKNKPADERDRDTDNDRDKRKD